MSKDLLKEAIADAKAVRETAIANAKLALEEAFTPKLQSMLSTKISEDLEDEEGFEDEEAFDVATEMSHEEEEEVEFEESIDGVSADLTEEDDEVEVEPEADEEDLELEAIIRELEGDEVTEEVTEEVEEAVEESTEESTDLTEDDDINLDEIIKSLEEGEDEEEEELEEVNELEEAYATIKQLQVTLQEVNLLNAKLLFSNKLFKSNNLSEAQKVKVIETLDRAANLREVKLVYTTLTESFSNNAPKAKIAEGLASKSVKSTKPSKEVIVESNDLAKRMKHLAGLL
jgi:hypothetical protein